MPSAAALMRACASTQHWEALDDLAVAYLPFP
jgi:hypothetical protein